MKAISYAISKIAPEDLENIAAMHLTAFNNHVNVKLGKRYIKAFLKWFIENTGTIYIVAKNERGEILGYVVGAKWGYQKRINKDLAGTAFISILKRFWIIFDKRIINSIIARLHVITGTSRHIRETQLELNGLIVSLVGIAVIDSAKGKGIASALIKSFEIRAKEMGFEIMRLSVYNSNKGARKFYEREGWQILPNTASLAVCGYIKKL